MTRRSASYAKDKEALLARLRRIEGQVRGLQQMVEDDRYCLDIVQQISALTAAAREVSRILVKDHLQQCMLDAVREHDDEVAVQAAVKELGIVLEKTLRA